MNTEEKTQKSCKICHRCKICHKTILGSKYNLKSHLYQHGVIRPRFKCSVCPKEYFRRDIYDRHMLAHEGKAKKHYICDHCERSFVDKRNLIFHLKIHDDLFVTPRVDFKCTACGVVYCEKRLLNHHIRKYHFSLANDGQTKPNFLKKKCNETWVERVKQTEVYVQMTKVNDNVLQIKKYDAQIEPKIECTERNPIYMNVFNGKDKSGYSKAICDYCKQEMLKKSIESHIRKRHSQTYNCKECNIDFAKRSQLASHICRSFFTIKDKSQYSKAICDYCKKEMLKKSLKSHIRERHLHIRRFKCEKCNEHFNRHYQMVNHVCGKFKSRKSRKIT